MQASLHPKPITSIVEGGGRRKVRKEGGEGGEGGGTKFAGQDSTVVLRKAPCYASDVSVLKQLQG